MAGTLCSQLLTQPARTLWYSTASWVSSIILSTSSIDITWKEEPKPAGERGLQGDSHKHPGLCPARGGGARS